MFQPERKKKKPKPTKTSKVVVTRPSYLKFLLSIFMTVTAVIFLKLLCKKQTH